MQSKYFQWTSKTWIFSPLFLMAWICQHEIWWNGIDYSRFSQSCYKIDFFYTIFNRTWKSIAAFDWVEKKLSTSFECNRLCWFILKEILIHSPSFSWIFFFALCVCVWSKEDSTIYSWSTKYLNESFVVWWFQYLRRSKPHTYLHKAFLSEWIDCCVEKYSYKQFKYLSASYSCYV